MDVGVVVAVGAERVGLDPRPRIDQLYAGESRTPSAALILQLSFHPLTLAVVRLGQSERRNEPVCQRPLARHSDRDCRNR